MKLLLKLNLVLLAVFLVGGTVSGWLAYQLLRRNARDQVLQQAQLMMETALSLRSYTTQQIKPLLQGRQAREKTFLPQAVPAYAATEGFNYLRKRFPDYSYKEATLNPTNLRDRAVDWETDVVGYFRNHNGAKERSGERDGGAGKTLFLARPIQAGRACLECHSTPQAAPAAMIKVYGSNNGFGWMQDEIVGAQIVSVPTSLADEAAMRAFQTLMISLGGSFVFCLVALDLALLFLVIRPLSKLSKAADAVSGGNLQHPELVARGTDELSVLAASFNRLHRSVARAMHMLEN